MFIKLILLFTIVPIVELALLIKIGQYIGVLFTILLVGLTGVIGVSLARTQGLKVISKVKAKLDKGSLPTDDLISGLLILIGGVMLLTPGLLTDITGFSLILPGSRNILAKIVKTKFKKYIKNNHIHYHNFDFDDRNSYRNSDYVDVEYEKDDED